MVLIENKPFSGNFHKTNEDLCLNPFLKNKSTDLKKNQIFLFVLFTVSFGFSQQKKIRFNAEIQFSDQERYPGATVLIGKVRMLHQGAVLTSKKAIYYKESRFFRAIGDVVINQGDTLTQTSDYVDYDANSKKVISWGNVVLKDVSMTLTTDTLYFNRVSQVVYYKNHGIIKDTTNVLRSKNGNYHLKQKKFTATSKVTITNPKNLIESNHLDYYTNSGQSFLHGPSTITDQKTLDKIYAEKGFYNTKTDISYFVKNAKLFLNNRTIEGDSLYYDKKQGFASATNNIKVIDTTENFVAKGNYAEYFQKKDSIFMTKKAVAISIVENDSTFIHGDTLLVNGKEDHRIIRSFYNSKIFKKNLQAACDSLYSNQALGITEMHVNPILWVNKSQITGDSIKLLSNKKTEKLDSIKVLGNSFIIQKDSIDPENFNQIKGRDVYGKFMGNQLRTVVVKGNGEAINFNRSEEGILETITKQFCSDIEFNLINSKINQMKCLRMSDGKTYPPSKYPQNERRLKGFLWRESEQPKRKEDIFRKKPSKKAMN